MRGIPTTGRLLGALRYGPSSASGPDPASRFLAMTPVELGGLGCYDFYQNSEVIISAKAQFTADQLAALQARAEECTGSKDPRLLVEGGKQVLADPVGAITGGLLGDGLLAGVADVLGNIVLATGGVVLVILGALRLFGVSGGDAARVAVGRGV